jgi:hypothetical protein
MSPKATLLLYLLLEQGSLLDGDGPLARPWCAEGLLQPPLIDEVRARRESPEPPTHEGPPRLPRLLPEDPPPIDFAAPASGAFTRRVPWPYFFTRVTEAASCFG